MATKDFCLKSCPICGESKVEILFDESSSLYRAECDNCGLKTGLHSDLTTATMAWNRRFRDACLKAPFPYAPWKFFFNSTNNHYLLTQTNEKFEVKKILLDMEMADSSELPQQDAELILRLLTASPVMYTQLVKLVKLLEEDNKEELSKAIEDTKDILTKIYPKTENVEEAKDEE